MWELLRTGAVRVFDLRTEGERSRYGWPPGAEPVFPPAHALFPDRDAVYLCQHAVRSKLPAARGAREVAGGFVAWRRAGLPVERRGDAPPPGRADPGWPVAAGRAHTAGSVPGAAAPGTGGLTPARMFDLGMALVDRLVAAPQRRWVAARVSGRLLEVGAGTGRNTGRRPAGDQAVGVDLNLGRLHYARARGAGFAPVVADMTRLPFADGCFDTLVSTFTFCEVADPAAALGEFRRVLRPGGRLLMLEHVAARSWPLRTVQVLLESATVPLLGEHLARSPLAALAGSGFTVGEHREWLGGVIQCLDARRRG